MPARHVESSFSSLGEVFRNLLDKEDNCVHLSFVDRRGHPMEDGATAESGVEFSGAHLMARGIKEKLESCSDRGAGGVRRLFSFQVNAVANIVFRPPSTKATRVIREVRTSFFDTRVHGVCRHSGVVNLKVPIRRHRHGVSEREDVRPGGLIFAMACDTGESLERGRREWEEDRHIRQPDQTRDVASAVRAVSDRGRVRLEAPRNVLLGAMEEMPLHRRLVLASADAGSIRSIVFGVNGRSLLR